MRTQDAAEPITLDQDLIVHGDNLAVLQALPAGTFDLIYMDPPFNTGRAQGRRTLSVAVDPAGERVGFGGRRYRSRLLSELQYDDGLAHYLGFLEPRLRLSPQRLRG